MKAIITIEGIDDSLDYSQIEAKFILADLSSVDFVDRLDENTFTVIGTALDLLEGMTLPIAESYLVIKEVVIVKDIEEITNWDVFEDRTRSLLDHWSEFAKKNPNTTSADVITGFLSELNDGFTESLKNK